MQENKINRLKEKPGEPILKTSRNHSSLDLAIERYVKLGDVINIWKKISYGLLAVVILLFGISIYLFTQKTVYPYLIQVDKKTGEIISSEVLKDEGINIGEKEIEYFIQKFIVDTRTITKDKKHFDRVIKNVNYFLTSETQRKTANILSTEKINSFFDEEKTRDVEILSINVVNKSENSYQIRWREREYKKDGTLYKRVNLNAIIKIDFFKPTINQVSFNPLGIVINDYNISQEN